MSELIIIGVHVQITLSLIGIESADREHTDLHVNLFFRLVAG